MSGQYCIWMKVPASQSGRLIWVSLLSPLALLGEMVQQGNRPESFEIWPGSSHTDLQQWSTSHRLINNLLLMLMSSVTRSDTTPTPDHCSLPRELLALGLVAPGYIPPCLRQPACFCTGTPLRPVRLPENLSTRVNFGYRRHTQRQRKQKGTSLACVIPCRKGCPQETPNNSSTQS